MALIPFFARLTLAEYFYLLVTVTILVLDFVLRTLILTLPQSVLGAIKGLFIKSEDYSHIDSQSPTNVPTGTVPHARELAERLGLDFEEHIVLSDDYVLGLHRVSGYLDSEKSPTETSPVQFRPSRYRYAGRFRKTYRHASSPVRVPAIRSNKPVALLGHGFLMCSEVWLCSKSKSLVSMLVSEGYDVWMLNTRGNKYSYKHRFIKPQNEEFWNFSLDEFACDLENVIDYILEYTGQKSVFYIGFSQGTAILFAALSAFPTLNPKIKLACCLAPTGKPHDLRSSFVSGLIKTAPFFLFLVFGCKSAFSSVSFWNSVIPTETWVRVLDLCMKYLFSWEIKEISHEDKAVCYRHLYSPSSVKSIVHWFQIIRSKSFSMYDDSPGLRYAFSHTHVPVTYPLKSIRTPIALFYGGADTLSDMEFIKEALPKPVYTVCVDQYEHLDCLWASSAHRLVFPQVISTMKNYE